MEKWDGEMVGWLVDRPKNRVAFAFPFTNPLTRTASAYGPSSPRLSTALVRDRPMRNSADR
jgi:hypothetical protein